MTRTRAFWVALIVLLGVPLLAILVVPLDSDARAISLLFFSFYGAFVVFVWSAARILTAWHPSRGRTRWLLIAVATVACSLVLSAALEFVDPEHGQNIYAGLGWIFVLLLFGIPIVGGLVVLGRSILAAVPPGLRTRSPQMPSTAKGAAVSMRQTYRYGWVYAVAHIGYGIPVSYAETMVPREVAIDLSMLALGLAAATIRPWAWHVLVIGNPLSSVAAWLWLKPSGPPARLVGLLALAVVMNAVTFVYFYRRRAMFGAPARWRVLESVCPWIVGPEDVVGRVGLLDLQWPRQALVVAIIAALVLSRAV